MKIQIVVCLLLLVAAVSVEAFPKRKGLFGGKKGGKGLFGGLIKGLQSTFGGKEKGLSEVKKKGPLENFKKLLLGDKKKGLFGKKKKGLLGNVKNSLVGKKSLFGHRQNGLLRKSLNGNLDVNLDPLKQSMEQFTHGEAWSLVKAAINGPLEHGAQWLRPSQIFTKNENGSPLDASNSDRPLQQLDLYKLLNGGFQIMHSENMHDVKLQELNSQPKYKLTGTVLGGATYSKYYEKVESDAEEMN